MTSNELRKKFIKFFEEKGHKHLPSSSLIPENDPSVLFTTAGMHPLVPYLMGKKHPLGKRLVNYQKCLRTGDIEEVGDTQHLTFFEMLGYWSFGDYFKKKSIRYTFDFYTKILDFKKDDISVTVFAGDKDAPFDEESYNTWVNDIGIPKERIYKYLRKENWWGPVSKTGPCGPCTEIFIDTGIKLCGKDCGPFCDCDKFIEIGNNVFIEYFKNKESKFEKLEQKNIDVGLGFERLVMFTQGKETIFETDLFKGVIARIRELARENKKDSEKSVRIIADHLRSATFALAEKIEPSNLDRGYVVRRLIRRSIRYGKLLGIKDKFTSKIAKEVIKKMNNVYPELRENEKFICQELDKEEERFRKTLKKGFGYLSKQLEKISKFNEGKEILTGKKSYSFKDLGKLAFDMFQNYGFPLEMTKELIDEKLALGMKVDHILLEKSFNEEYVNHQDLSRKGAEKKFKGGLAAGGEQETKYHTATHILQQALRDVLGDHVGQKGSNITAERLRFDFSHHQKMTPEEIKKTEDIVNKKIKEKLPVKSEKMGYDEAVKKGAIVVYSKDRYPEKVTVYSVGNYSKEICGGPHIKNTSELGHFKIKKEEASSAGVRRIKAILQ